MLLVNIVGLFYAICNKFKFRKVCCSKIIIGPEFNRNFVIKSPHLLEIGEGSVINGDCYINAYGGVKIGIFCHLGKGLTIYSHNHNYCSNSSIPYDEKEILRPVIIGDAVWIGANVTIAPGTIIGDGVVVAIGSVVSGSIPSCAVVGGNPARIIKYRDIEIFQKLKNGKKFS